MRNFYRAIVAATAAAIIAASAAMPSDAAPRHRAPLPSPAFDGLWSVSIMTQYGDCNRAYRYPLRIVDGYVTKADDDSAYAVAGAVARSGAIGVTVSGGGQSAIGVGRLTLGGGRGLWHTSNGECGGNWTAQRRS
jgi:hypothetical protein